MSERKAEKKYRWYWFCVFLCRNFCRIFFRMRVCGLENVPTEGGFLLVSNHQSFLDPLFCGIFVKRGLTFMARDTLFRNRFFGRLLRSVNAIAVRRGEADLTAIKAIISRLKEQEGVCIFPEATRTADGKIRDFKAGIGFLCRKGRASIVPVVIDGAFEAWPRSKKFFKPFCTISVSYGKPLFAEDIKDCKDGGIAKKLTSRLRQMQSELRIEQGKEVFIY
ncbi:MAG: 1-acyl-sn-glycerol-3-phosphate acyltransferase [Planctomycetes bacterium]|nr:1-acyl-sn-glycerol-3-phosphate acyltransferase [Planctomycetota bacterium]